MTHGSRLATREVVRKGPWTRERPNLASTVDLLDHSGDIQNSYLLTLVYWNDSCRPVKVDSIDWGVVSISHVPSAVHNAEQECFNLWLS